MFLKSIPMRLFSQRNRFSIAGITRAYFSGRIREAKSRRPLKTTRRF